MRHVDRKTSYASLRVLANTTNVRKVDVEISPRTTRVNALLFAKDLSRVLPGQKYQVVPPRRSR